MQNHAEVCNHCIYTQWQAKSSGETPPIPLNFNTARGRCLLSSICPARVERGAKSFFWILDLSPAIEKAIAVFCFLLAVKQLPQYLKGKLRSFLKKMS